MTATGIINEKKTYPSVSIILPTNVKYPHFKNDEQKIKALFKEASQKLSDEFPAVKANPIIEKLNGLISGIDYEHLSKGIAIYASPNNEKVIHLPFSVTEKVIIDQSFEVRDLLYASKKSFAYMLIAISGNGVAVYEGYNNTIIKSDLKDLPQNTDALKIDAPTRVSNFTTPSELNETNLLKYLSDIDEVISNELKNVPANLIIAGVDKTLGYFKKMTKNANKIIAYVNGNFEHSNKNELLNAIEPVIKENNKKNEILILNQLEEAVNQNKFSSGIVQVWRSVAEGKGRLLIVEKDYCCAAKLGEDQFTLITGGIDENAMFVMKDAVDDLMEMNLRLGGDVAFVSNGKLKTHMGIALIERY